MNDQQMLKWLQDKDLADFDIDLSTQDGKEKLANIASFYSFKWDAGKGWT